MSTNVRSCWSEVQKLNGQEYRTLDQHRPVRVVAVESGYLKVAIGSTGKTRRISQDEVDCAFNMLVKNGEITRTEIRDNCSQYNPAYVAMILAQLPRVKTDVNPIRLTYKVT